MSSTRSQRERSLRIALPQSDLLCHQLFVNARASRSAVKVHGSPRLPAVPH